VNSENKVTLSVDDGTTMDAYVSRPAGAGPHPGILVFQEALGVNAQMRGVADRYAKLGFVAIAPELFHRVRPGYEANEIVMTELMPLVKTLTSEGLISDANAAYGWLTSDGSVAVDMVAAVGYCMGGRTVYLANSALPLAAGISYYAGGVVGELLERVPSLHAPHLFFWGGQDKGIPPEQHRALTDAMRAANKKFVDVEFSDCNHAFFNEQADRYNAAAAKQSWAIGAAFLEDTLGIKLSGSGEA
jgi:Dienelactone hydrolase and related enzymes